MYTCNTDFFYFKTQHQDTSCENHNLKMPLQRQTAVKTQNKGKKRKAADDSTSTSQNPKHAKASTGNNATASTLKESATGGTQRHRQATVMSEEEDAASHGDDAIYISSDEEPQEPQESEAKSSKEELGEKKSIKATLLAKLSVLIHNRMPTQKWTSLIYAFYHPILDIEYANGH